MRGGPGRMLGWLALAGITLAACDLSGLNFFVDERVTIVEPDPYEQVTLPVTVRWTVEDFEVDARADGDADPGSGRFAVLVDRDPAPPGEGLAWYARDDQLCAEDPGCPNEEYLRRRNVYLTSQRQFTIDAIPDLRVEGRGRDLHRVMIVLIDGRNRRIGESAFTREFVVERAAGTDGEIPTGLLLGAGIMVALVAAGAWFTRRPASAPEAARRSGP